MSHSFRRSALSILFGLVWLGASAQGQAPAAPGATAPVAGSASSSSGSSPGTTSAGSAGAHAAAASAPGEKKRSARVKTPPGKPPAGASSHCNQPDKAQRQRCLNDMYGPGGPRI